MRYGSVCSGIEAATVAWHPLGWEPVFFAEIEPFPSAVLAHHWSGVPNVGDFTRIGRDVGVEPIDLLVGGTPCQSFSVAGRRQGLDDPRGNLTLEYLALVGRLRPRWVVWENVPGVLSDDGGRTFGTVLGLLGKLGYGVAYRVLDAQFFGVPQRRRRVFVVGYLGAWQRAAAVLLEPSCMSGNPPPRRKARESVAASLTHGVDSGGRGGYAGRRREDDVNLAVDLQNAGLSVDVAGTIQSEGSATGNRGYAVIESVTPVSHPILAKSNSSHDGTLETYVAHSLRADGFDASVDGTGRGTPMVAETLRGHPRPGSNSLGALGFYPTEGRDFVSYDESSPAVKVESGGTSGNPPGVATFDERNITSKANRTRVEYGAPANTLHESPLGLVSAMAVRRLTPRECERLQGFPDDWTAITYKGKPAADGPRYRALGNSMAVPCMAWIGERIELVDGILRESA